MTSCCVSHEVMMKPCCVSCTCVFVKLNAAINLRLTSSRFYLVTSIKARFTTEKKHRILKPLMRYIQGSLTKSALHCAAGSQQDLSSFSARSFMTHQETSLFVSVCCPGNQGSSVDSVLSWFPACCLHMCHLVGCYGNRLVHTQKKRIAAGCNCLFYQISWDCSDMCLWL